MVKGLTKKWGHEMRRSVSVAQKKEFLFSGKVLHTQLGIDDRGQKR